MLSGISKHTCDVILGFWNGLDPRLCSFLWFYRKSCATECPYNKTPIAIHRDVWYGLLIYTQVQILCYKWDLDMENFPGTTVFFESHPIFSQKISKIFPSNFSHKVNIKIVSKRRTNLISHAKWLYWVSTICTRNSFDFIRIFTCFWPEPSLTNHWSN